MLGNWKNIKKKWSFRELVDVYLLNSNINVVLVFICINRKQQLNTDVQKRRGLFSVRVSKLNIDQTVYIKLLYLFTLNILGQKDLEIWHPEIYGRFTKSV